MPNHSLGFLAHHLLPCCPAALTSSVGPASGSWDYGSYKEHSAAALSFTRTGNGINYNPSLLERVCSFIPAFGSFTDFFLPFLIFPGLFFIPACPCNGLFSFFNLLCPRYLCPCLTPVSSSNEPLLSFISVDAACIQ